MLHNSENCRVIAHSTPGPDRADPESNQDAFDWAWIGDVLVAVVSDGVSSSAHGGQASRIGSAAYVAYLKTRLASEVPGEGQAFVRLAQEAAFAAHEAVLAAYSDGSALATLVGMLVDSDRKQLAIVHAGDSLAYLYRGGNWAVATEPHIRAAPVLLNGKTVIRDGMPMMRQGITRCLGAEPFGADAQLHSYNEGDAVVLCSDGVSPEYAKQINSAAIWQWATPDVRRVAGTAAVASDDDATLVAVGLGRSSGDSALEARLSSYASLSGEERDRLIAAMNPSSLVSPNLIRSCFEVETEETRQVALFRLISMNLSNRAHLAELATRAGQDGKRQLLGLVLDKLRRM